METAETLSLLGVTHHLSRTLCSEFTKFPSQGLCNPFPRSWNSGALSATSGDTLNCTVRPVTTLLYQPRSFTRKRAFKGLMPVFNFMALPYQISPFFKKNSPKFYFLKTKTFDPPPLLYISSPTPE